MIPNPPHRTKGGAPQLGANTPGESGPFGPCGSQDDPEPSPACDTEPSPAMPYRKAPCAECPWRTDVAPGRFPATRFEELRSTSVQPEGTEAVLAALIHGQDKFGCHKGAPRTGEDLACAGWLAVAGWENFSVRRALLEERLPPQALELGPNWTPLYESYDAMAHANRVSASRRRRPHRRADHQVLPGAGGLLAARAVG
ncbi:DUF6283 family protein [Streptomyces sp. LHD-70]|uniref:DUF6283 family protein n=1 Tax=Streptomyces sp. LHD-70 TaxID=3072140 RepID=UPI00280CAB60|nr:DUF6283 family protein [Streptomyces sp. LHD-70]MDQ8704904.1 DUF6283 family protein [Streptomyces sp. LHD-70]